MEREKLQSFRNHPTPYRPIPCSELVLARVCYHVSFAAATLPYTAREVQFEAARFPLEDGLMQWQ